MTNKKSTKRALLSSILSLLLCCSMLIGTTFAWFTDEVQSGNNIIQAGNLDVELEYAKVVNGTIGGWNSVQNATKVFDPNALWEPGRVEVVYLKVSNLGSLALKYQLGVNVVSETPGINVAGEEFKLSDHLVFKVVDMGDDLDTYTDREAVQAAAGASMGLKDYNGTTTAMEVGGVDYVALIVYMPETVGNEANYRGNDVPTITLGINLFATQQMAEEDSFGDDYDEDAWNDGMQVYNAQELKTALNNGMTNIVLMDDIDLTEPVVIPASTSVVLNLNGKTISNDNDYVFENYGHVVITGNGTLTGLGVIRSHGGSVVIENGNFYASSRYQDNNYQHTLKAVNTAVTINGGNFDATVNGQSNAMLNASENAVITINGGSFKNVAGELTAFDPYIFTYEKNGAVVINDGTFYGGWRFNGETATTDIYGGNFAVGFDGQSFNATSTHVLTVYGGTFTAGTKLAGKLENVIAERYCIVNNQAGDFVVLQGETGVANNKELEDALANGKTNIALGAGNYTMPTTTGDVTISGTLDTVITINKPTANNVTLNGVTVVGSGNYTGIQHSNTVVYENCVVKGVQFLYANKVIFKNCTIDLTEKADYIWTYGAKNVEFIDCTFNTAGKALLIYAEDANQVTNVTVKGCTFNATASALASGHVAAAIEIDSSLATNGHYTLITENNTVDADFAGEWRIKKSGADNTTVNGVVYNAVTLDGKLVAYDAAGLQAIVNAATGNLTVYFANDITGDVTVTQKPDVKITIDGNGHTFAGVIVVDGKSKTYTTAGLTIRNVNFKADSISADACIRLGDGTNDTRYTCNVTVEGCTFDVPGAVGIKSYTGGDKNLTITGCTATANAHSLVQAKGIDGVLVENCKVYSKNGLNFNNSDNVTVIGCEVDVKGYAVRFGESSGGAGSAETYLIKDCTLKSANDDGDATIILRGTADYATLTIENTTIVGTPDIANTATGATVVR